MDPTLKYRSMKMRRNHTRAESGLWNLLRNRKLSRYKFRRQHIIHPYIVDFICMHKKLIIELDGHTHEHQIEYDKRRTKYLEKQGYRVVRFTNAKLLSHAEVVLDEILEELCK